MASDRFTTTKPVKNDRYPSENVECGEYGDHTNRGRGLGGGKPVGTELEPGVSRRDLLKKGAVAGGIVWTAPLVLSARDVAGADHTGPASAPTCALYYAGMYPTDDTGTIRGPVSACEGSFGSQGCYQAPTGTTYRSGCSAVTSIDTATNTIHLASTINGKQILDVFGSSKASNNVCADATVVKNADGTWSVTYPRSVTGGNPSGTAATSNVQFVLCTAE